MNTPPEPQRVRKRAGARTAASPPMPLRARKKLATRTALIEAGRRLFARKGYDAVTLDEICDAVPVHRTTFFSYFASKEELALAYQVEKLEAFRVALRERPAGADVIALWWKFYDDIGQPARGRENSLLQKLMSVPALRHRYSDIGRQYAEEISGALAEDAGNRAIDRIHARVYAAALMAVQFEASEWLADALGRASEGVDTSRVARFLMDRFPSKAELAALLADMTGDATTFAVSAARPGDNRRVRSSSAAGKTGKAGKGRAGQGAR